MDIITNEIKDIKHQPIVKRSNAEIEEYIDKLIKIMTVEEKIGQLYQSPHHQGTITGPEFESSDLVDSIRTGNVGSILGLSDIQQIFKLQSIAVNESRLGIPLFFAFDVIHGYKTIFPINLGMACSWDDQLIEETCNVVAYEMGHSGVNLTFSPMLDLVRDPRWGRVMESFGEDSYLGSRLAKAYVKGYQKGDLSKRDAVGSCAKHFIGYGAVQGGREYNHVDISKREIMQNYLPPFKAAIEAGVSSIMSSFNVIDNIPLTANQYYLKDVLRDQLNFDGFTISDYNSTFELLSHRVAKNEEEVAYKCLMAGIDHEMVSKTYVEYLRNYSYENEEVMKRIDQATKRILNFKYQLGLFDDPYKNIYPKHDQFLLTNEARKKARGMACHSIVLLKNENVLPLQESKRIAIIGPHANNKEVIGGWEGVGEVDDCISLYEGMTSSDITNSKIVYAKGCDTDSSDKSNFKEAMEVAKESDIIILALGEDQYMTGEGYSRAYLNLPGVQEDLAKEIVGLGKMVILVLFNGRPLELNWFNDNVDAIVEAWFLGTESGNAIADVLYGTYNPSGKLTMSFPYAVGQIPVYYNNYNTGRPSDKMSERRYSSSYADIPNEPLYPFGYGLSYTKFIYNQPRVELIVEGDQQKVLVEAHLTNIGNLDGYEIVQLYIEAMSSSVTRPVKELKGYKKILLKKGKSIDVKFTLDFHDLAYLNDEMVYSVDTTSFKIYVGGCSTTTNCVSLEV